MKTVFFTGKGDFGESHFGKVTLKKSSLGADLLGALDELNSWVGLTRVEADKVPIFKSQGDLENRGSSIAQEANRERGNRNEEFGFSIPEVLKQVQNHLFILQAEVASLIFGFGGDKKITALKTKEMEEIIEKIDEKLPPITKFILVGGSELSARLDVCRAISRRVERLAKKFSEDGSTHSADSEQASSPRENKLSPDVLQYLNRISSLFFALARYVNYSQGIEEESPDYK